MALQNKVFRLHLRTIFMPFVTIATTVTEGILACAFLKLLTKQRERFYYIRHNEKNLLHHFTVNGRIIC